MRRTNSLRMAKPYKSALQKDWEEMKEFYMENVDLVTWPLTVLNDTALHVAVYSGTKHPLEELHRLSPKAYRIPNVKGNTVLHEAVATGNIEAAKFLLKVNSEELLHDKNALGETPLFRAAAFGKIEMVELLHSPVQNVAGNLDVHRTRNDKNSLLHIAIHGQHFETASWLLENDSVLRELKDQYGRTCLQLLARMPAAFRSGHPMNKWERMLYFCLPDEDYEVSYNQGNDSEQGRPNLCHPSRFANIRRAVSRMNYYLFWKFLIRGAEVERIWKKKKNHVSVNKLIQQLIREDTSWQLSLVEPDLGARGGEPAGGRSRDELPRITASTSRSSCNIAVVEVGVESSSRAAVDGGLTPLLMAARTGIVEIVERILEMYPQAIDHVSYKGQNILHVAIRHRQKKIFDLVVNKQRVALNWLTLKIDNKGRTLLHHAAYIDYKDKLTYPNSTLQLQVELNWYENVKKIVPSYFAMHLNNKGETAEEIFHRTHVKLHDDAETWLKQTAKSCSVITVLIATVAYASAYTVPGGLNQQTGIPVLIHNHIFFLFAIMDVLALVTSLTSAVLFLSILTSSFKYEDFHHSLPRKLTLGIAFLYLSVALTMLAFAATILLIIHLNGYWTATVVYIVAFIPVAVFAWLHFPLYIAVSRTMISGTFGFIRAVFPFNLIVRSFGMIIRAFSTRKPH